MANRGASFSTEGRRRRYLHHSPKAHHMTPYKLLVLPGDGIGPEVMAEVEKILAWLTGAGIVHFEVEKGLVGGAAYDAHGKAISEADMDRAKTADAVLFGAVGGPRWDHVPYDVRPEAGLLRLRKDLQLFANLRPAICYPALADASSLKRELVEGLDLMIVRELTGGVYFGEPKEIIDLGNGQKRGIDTQVYDTYEIERIGRVAFDLARRRRNKVTSSEKRNVMKSGVLWHEVISALHTREYPDVALEHQLADALGMQLVRRPKQFDVIVTDNLFGDMLSDVASMLTGSLGMLPSASLGEKNPRSETRKALYEPVHGSAPDIAGKGIANPIAMIGSLGMALRYSFNHGDLADRIETAIAAVLAKGIRTGDIAGDAQETVSTTQMGDAILAELQAGLA
jgi:3-isopropylmalate dehydrogenase